MPEQAEIEAIAEGVAAQYLTQVHGDGEDFQIYSAVRYDPTLYNPSKSSSKLPLEEAINAPELDHSFFFLFSGHIKRLNNTVRYFDWVPSSQKDKSIDIITPTKLASFLTSALSSYDRMQCYKIRLFLNKDFEFDCEIGPVPHRNLMVSLEDPNAPVEQTVYLDPQSLVVNPFTSFKTSMRDHYDDARKRCLPDIATNPEQDVILHNTMGQVTEASICNVAFWRTANPHPVTGEIKEGWFTPPLSSGCLCGTVRDYLVTNGLVGEMDIPVKSITEGETVLLFNGIRGVIKGVMNLKLQK